MTHPSDKQNLDLTAILQQASDGNSLAVEELYSAVYGELQKIAQRRLARERSDHTLQATALVNEAYLKLVDQKKVQWQSRAQFYKIAARAMRRILVDHARRRGSLKRGGDLQKATFDDRIPQPKNDNLELIALDDALGRLEAVAPEQAKVAELRFFGGLSEDEIAEAMGVTARSVRRYWKAAKAWLRDELSQAEPDPS